MENIEYNKFQIVKSYVDNQLSKNLAYICKPDLNRWVDNVGLRAKVLADLLVREVEEHNSAISATRTRLKNLKYKYHRTYQSKLITGHHVPFGAIDELLKANPELDWVDVLRKLHD
jgi:hypothetical protein